MMKILLILFLLLSDCVFAADNHEPVLFKANHPDSWTIQESDTPWYIARIFLENPWRWSEAWENNLPPDFLFPGDQIKTIQKDGTLFLQYITHQNFTHPFSTIKLGPQITTLNITKSSELFSDMILPFQDLAVFINQGLIVKNHEYLQDMPRITLRENKGLFSVQGEQIYAKHDKQLKNNKNFKIYRQRNVYKDLDSSSLLGVDMQYIGQAHVDGNNQNLFRLHVDSTKSEVLAGDFLIPDNSSEDKEDFILRPAQKESKIIALLTHADLAGQYASVVIRGGNDQKIQKGELFSVYKPSVILHVNDIEHDKNEKAISNIDYIFVGKLMVYKVFDNLSYAFVMESSKPIAGGDLLRPYSPPVNKP